MKFKYWIGSACALSLISATLTGCGGGGGGGSTSSSSAPAASTSLDATSGSSTLSAPQVSAAVVDPASGSTMVNLTDSVSGKVLSGVVVPANLAFQPTTGQPALVVDAAALNMGVKFGTSGAQPQAFAHSATPVSYVSLYQGNTVNSANLLLKAGIGSDGKLQNSVALAAVPGTYTLNFTDVIASTKPGTSLIIDNLDFVFQVRLVSGQAQTTLPINLKGILPAFGEQITHDPAKPDWTGGGILFALDPSAVGGNAELFVDHANGQIDAQSTIGNYGTSAGNALTEILTKPNGPTMGAPCRKVQLTCLFPTS
jgi:hypothetical protein